MALAGPLTAAPVSADNGASLNIKKVNEDGARLAGAVFAVEGVDGTFTTEADGFFCIVGLPPDTDFVVTEIQAPPGYMIPDPAWQLVATDDDGDCDSPDATFVNIRAQASQSAESSVEASAEASVEASVEASAEASVEASVEASAEASVEASVEGSVMGGVGTPSPTLPDTASDGGTSPSLLPVLVFGLMVFGSLVTLVAVNLQAVRRRI